LKTKIIAEVGLNHMGSVSLAKKYLNSLVKTDVDGISFQIKSKSFYNQFKNSKKNKDISFYKNFREKFFYINNFKKKKFQSLELPNNFYKYAKNICKKNNKMFGIALGDIDKVFFLSKIKVDFIKILSEDFYNFSLIKKLLKSNITLLYLSTGSILYKDVNFFIKSLRKPFLKKISVIYTKFSNKISDIDLKNIVKYKKIHPDVSYGNHSYGLSSIFKSLKYNPNSIFFYVKGNRINISHPDERHAIRLKDLKQILKKIRN
jgi:N,N'-diacetyllegionaminate synthase